MLHIKSLKEGLDIFKALGSEVRIEIIEALLENRGMNMNELAGRLNISNGALTGHIKKLEECGLVSISNESAGHGNQKKCFVHLDKILVDLDGRADDKNVYQTDIKVGHFSDYKVYPTCGLASGNAIIGEVDDVRYFAHPDRYNADMLWFTQGFVEYMIPNFIPCAQKNRSDYHFTGNLFGGARRQRYMALGHILYLKWQENRTMDKPGRFWQRKRSIYA